MTNCAKKHHHKKKNEIVFILHLIFFLLLLFLLKIRYPIKCFVMCRFTYPFIGKVNNNLVAFVWESFVCMYSFLFAYLFRIITNRVHDLLLFVFIHKNILKVRCLFTAYRFFTLLNLHENK